jgi:hypothetical protein
VLILRRLFAQIGGHGYDPELLYVSFLSHDIALSNRYRDSRHCGCFAHEGGEVAKSWLTSRDVKPEFSDTVAQVIAQQWMFACRRTAQRSSHTCCMRPLISM